MTSQKAIGFVLIALLSAAATIYGPPATSKTTDMSDLWWIPAESGWGIQFVEEETTIFATMFVYGPDGNPTWYVATMDHVSFLAWSGTLYATTGPWFGAVPFPPASVTGGPVGTMTFASTSVATGLLTYSVNSVQVVKHIERQTLVDEDYSGAFAGALSQQGNGLPSCNPADNTSATPINVQILQNRPAMTLVTQTAANTCSFGGTYSRYGQFTSARGSYSCSSGDTGTYLIFEMAVSWYDFRARALLPAIQVARSRAT